MDKPFFTQTDFDALKEIKFGFVDDPPDGINVTGRRADGKPLTPENMRVAIQVPGPCRTPADVDNR
jgi:hypothetical protein